MKASAIRLSVVVMIGLFALGVVGCDPQTNPSEPLAQRSPIAAAAATDTPTAAKSTISERIVPEAVVEVETASATPDEIAAAETVEFTLETAVAKGKLLYVGVGGAIDSLVNPDLEVKAGDSVQVTLVNGDGMQHDVSFPDFGATSSLVHGRGDSTVITFEVDSDRSGVFAYFCTVPGHRRSGQEGRLVVSER